MFNATKYGPGLIGVALIWVLANWTSNSGVARDLTARAAAAIPKDAVDKPTIVIAGRDATLSGAVFSPAGAESALAAVDAVAGVRLTQAATQPLAEAKPYIFSALREGAKVTLSGNVPDPATRSKLVAAAKTATAGGEVVDQMTYASAPPQAFDVMAGFAVNGLANLVKGNSSLSGGAYTLAGQAASPAGFEAANAMVQKLSPGMTLAKADIQPSAEQVAAAKAAADKAAQEAAAKSAFEKAAQEAAAKAAAEKAAQQSAAKAASDKAAQEAAAKAAADKAAQEAAAKAAADAKEAAAKPATLPASTNVAAVSPPAAAAAEETAPLDIKACQSKFNAQLLDETIEFHTGKTEVTPKGEALLGLLVKTGKRCPKARIEIAGFTDSVGNPEANLALSAKRAEAVLAALVRDGLDPSLLSAKGFGEANPVASNDTAEGRAKNRRIEFNVQE